MSRAVAPLVAGFLLAETLLFRLAPDAPASLVLPLHALGVVLAALLAPRLRAGERSLLVLLLFLAAGLGWLETREAWLRMSAGPAPESAIRAELERDAEAALEALDRLLTREQEFFRSLPDDLFAPGVGRPELFARLDEIEKRRGAAVADSGITVFDSGRAIAWAGKSSVAARALRDAPSAPDVAQLLHRGSLETTLVTAAFGGARGERLVAGELVLATPSSPGAWRALSPLPGTVHSELGLELLDPEDADPALRDFLPPSRGRYWKRGSGGLGQLLAAWRAPTGEILGLLTVSPESPSSAAAREARRRSGSRQAVLALGALAAFVLMIRGARRARLDLAALAALTVLLPALRLAFGTPSPLLVDLPVFDYRLFSAPLPLGLASSPGDVLLTSLAVLALAGLGAAAVRRGGAAGAAAGGAAAVLLGAGLVLVSGPWVTDSNLNPARVPVLPPEAAHLALTWAHASIAMAAAVLVLAALAPRRRRLSLRAIAGALLAAGALSHLLFVREAARVPVSLIERSLAPEVLRARTAAVERVSDFLADAASDPRWQAVASMNGPGRERLTFEGWRASDLGRAGARSAIAVLDLEGRIISSFAYGLPASVFEDTAGPAREVARPAAEDPSGPSSGGAEPPPAQAEQAPVIAETSLRVLSLSVPLLRGEAIVARDEQPPCRIAVLLSTEWDNLPFLTLGDPLLRALGTGGAERYNEYFDGAPLFVAYSGAGEVLFPSAEQVAPLAPALLGAREPLWTTTLFAGTEYRTYLFPTPDGPRAIGYVAPSAVKTIAGLLRALGVQLPLVALVLLGVAALRTRDLAAFLSPGRWTGLLGASYSRRVQAIVLTCALVPLVLLAVIFRDTLERRTRESVERAGVQSAATIRRLLEDYVESGAAGAGSAVRIGSRTLFWVARTVHQDIHLFVGEELVATSRGDTEASGLRGFRLDASVARALVLGRPPQILSRQPLPGGRTALVYAPVTLTSDAPEGVFALPLLVQERDLTRGGEAIADALLVATTALGVLLSIIGYLFARRLSVPIRDLALASRTIAGGRLEVRVQPRGKDEIRQLIDAFNTMAAALGEQREDLRRRKDYIEAILLNVTTGVISTDARGVVRTSNPAASLVLGLPVDLVGRDLFAELRGRHDLAPVLDAWAEGVRGARPGAAREVSIRREDAEVRLRSVVLPLAETDSGEPGSIFLVEDVTEVMRSNRLAAWAEMARRIAHEIKNPLTPIQLSAEHLLRVRNDAKGSDFDRVLRQCVETILGQVRELREIASEFSTYARLPDLRLVPADLEEILRGTLAPYAATPPRGVEVRTRIERLPPVRIDPRVLNRAFVNLIDNALQAMEGGGVLSITLRRAPRAAGDLAEIVFEDTGEGMDEATRVRIFEPYFSTRDTGTGLGLAIAKRAVEDHGGTLTVESTRGRGTRMIVRLPLEPQGAGHPDGHLPGLTFPSTPPDPGTPARAQNAAEGEAGSSGPDREGETG